MRRPTSAIALFLLSALLAACGGPTVVNHVAPTVTVDVTAWQEMLDEQCPPTEYGRRECDPESSLGAPVETGGMGCDAISLPDAPLGGLDPAYPLLLCEIHPVLHGDDLQEIMEGLEASGDYLYRGGGLWPVFTRYVIRKGDALELLRNAAAMQGAYAPIETPEEALSYALASTGYEALFGLKREPGLAYAVDRLEDTHARPTDDGFDVLLYHHQVFGCGPHWTSAVLVSVGRDGTVTESDWQQVYRNPDDDGLCVD